MSKRGENIYKRRDNRWEGRYVKGKNSQGKTTFGYVYAKSYREVRQKLAAAKQNATDDVVVQSHTLDHYCEEWLALARNRVKESSFVKYRNIVRGHLQPRLGEICPQDIDGVCIEAFSDSLLAEGLSPKTVRDVLTVLKAILKHCRCVGVYSSAVEVVCPKEQKGTARVLSVEEQQTLIRYLLTDTDLPKFGALLALLTGMRIGELCALKWKDVSLTEGVIHVCSAMQRLQKTESSDVKTRIVIADTKSQASQRVIPLTDTAAKLCGRYAEEEGEAYVLTGDKLRFMEPRTMQYRLQKYTKDCGLSGVHFHTLRHTFATRCVEVGFEIKSLSEVLGHASTKVTLDRYVHSSLAFKRENMNKLAAVGF